MMSPAMLDAIAAMQDQAAITIENVISSGAKQMVKNPWRICRAVYPYLSSHWPMDKDASVVLSDCRKQISYLIITQRTDGDTSLTALRQAERALMELNPMQ